ncbi:hypothetical protein ACFVYA_33785 [Amycolatopsis sp. NPDC058278]|uniref:hypothetical protein n=1 Tax=Amycolatopsis sp. NPDC058278 TaxID=3346417 RepID=UPI0036D918FD
MRGRRPTCCTNSFSHWASRPAKFPAATKSGPLADCLLKKSLQLLDLGFGEDGVEATAEAVELRRLRGDDDRGQAVPTGALLRMLALAALTEVVEVRKRFVAAKEAGRTVSSRG